MTHETTLIYSEPLLRQAVFAFWCRSLGAGFIIALIVVALSFGVLVALGATSWLLGVLGTVLVMGVAFPAALYFIHYRNALLKLRYRFFYDRRRVTALRA